MNIYYSDDELRKQSEYLAGKLVTTSQEAVETKSTMREDVGVTYTMCLRTVLVRLRTRLANMVRHAVICVPPSEWDRFQRTCTRTT